MSIANSATLASTTSKISFGVKKKKEIVNNSICLPSFEKKATDNDDDLEEQDAKKIQATHFDGSRLKPAGGDTTAKKTSITVPVIVEKDWRVRKLLENLLQKKKKEVLTPEEEAKLALLSSEEHEDNTETLLELGELEANYDSVPVENFGLAVLNAYNRKGNGKQPVPLRKLPERRPPGLGLGNDVKLFKKYDIINTKGVEDKDNRYLKIGSYVLVKRGIHRGHYGQVESIDFDNASVVVKLALVKRSVPVSQYLLEIVDAEDYERNAKCINKKAYDDVKVALEKANMPSNSREVASDKSSVKDRRVEMSKKRRILETQETEVRRERGMWVRPELKVRFVNKKYKDGKLYNEKFVVVDAPDSENCAIQGPEGRIYYHIHEDWLETVIPHEGSCIMIVGGRWRGSLAMLEMKERKKERVVARLLHSEEIVKISYDDVCHWVGSTDIDDY
ncbi:unnamed protein product [Enterobius vermicularis]|uniref:KOW domain-containing protein n=1 Tax=Enterobius vermicularis TaxID=51028 RepID=A0A0N4VM07_ENTVE|nr:unnamed protein product [Enterobius vermicularis]